MQFYNKKLRKMVEVPDSEVTVVSMKNSKKAQATVEGMKLLRSLAKKMPPV